MIMDFLKLKVMNEKVEHAIQVLGSDLIVPLLFQHSMFIAQRIESV